MPIACDQRFGESFERFWNPISTHAVGTPVCRSLVAIGSIPEALERFTEALVTRYRHQVKMWCPFNEPLVSALFSVTWVSGRPTSGSGAATCRCSADVQAVSRAFARSARHRPEATVLLCDASETTKRGSRSSTEVKRRNLRRFIVMDLLTAGDRDHPLYTWITSYGLSELYLQWFSANPQTPDILGLDYYPTATGSSTWSARDQAAARRQSRRLHGGSTATTTAMASRSC